MHRSERRLSIATAIINDVNFLPYLLMLATAKDMKLWRVVA